MGDAPSFSRRGTCAPEPPLLLSVEPDLSHLEIEEPFEPGHDVLHCSDGLLGGE